MSRRWLYVALLVLLIVVGCGAEQEPAASKDLDEATAGADAAPDPAALGHEPETLGSIALAVPAADGLPEVRYYSLGGG